MAFYCSILGTFYFLEHLDSSSPVLLAFFLAVSLEAVIFYVLSVENLYKIPRQHIGVKRACLRILNGKVLRGGRLDPYKRLLHCRLKSKPTMAVREVGYRQLESLSTLVFIDFYVYQVISLLIAF